VHACRAKTSATWKTWRPEVSATMRHSTLLDKLGHAITLALQPVPDASDPTAQPETTATDETLIEEKKPRRVRAKKK
jgi:hypothetical protein